MLSVYLLMPAVKLYKFGVRVFKHVTRLKCVFLFVCSIYSECAVAIYSECMDAYTVCFIHMPGVYVCNPFM